MHHYALPNSNLKLLCFKLTYSILPYFSNYFWKSDLKQCPDKKKKKEWEVASKWSIHYFNRSQHTFIQLGPCAQSVLSALVYWNYTRSAGSQNELSGVEGRLKRQAHTSLGSLIKQEERGQLSGSILLTNTIWKYH